MAKYKIIPSSRTIVQSPISIGHKAEKGVEAIEFDLTAWVETYGSGTLTVIMRRWGDAIPYPIALEIDENNKATWTLSDIDTAKAGMAYAQLSYIVGETVVKKSDIYTFRVMDSLTGEGDPPEAYESWLEQLTHFAAEAMAEVLDIEGIVTDKTLTVDGGIADAKATGDALSALEDAVTEETDKLRADLDALEPGLSIEGRRALLNCLKNCAWDNEDGIRYYNELKSALGMGENKIYLYKFNNSLISSGNKDFGLTAPSPVYASGKYGKCIAIQAQTPNSVPRAFNISENNLPSLHDDFTISTWFKVGTNEILIANTCFRLAVNMNDSGESNSVTELTDLQYYNSYQNIANDFTIKRTFAGMALSYTILSDQFTPYFSWWNASINKVYLFGLRNDSYKILGNTWTHFAFCRKNNNCTIYIDGRKSVSFKYFGDFYIPNQMVIGSSLTAGTPNGISVPENAQPNVDELYINDGECIFDGEFTPSEIVL